MNDTYMTRKSDPKYDDDLVNKRYVDEKISYSFDEKIIGKWTDGRPYYEKSFYKSISIGSVVEIAKLNDLTLYDNILFHEVSFTKVQTDNNVRYWMPVFFQDSTDYARVYIRETDNKLLAYVKGSSVSELKVFVTLRYTKTTDF